MATVTSGQAPQAGPEREFGTLQGALRTYDETLKKRRLDRATSGEVARAHDGVVDAMKQYERATEEQKLNRY